MTEQERSAAQLLEALKERAKELNCIYQVEELLQNKSLSLEEILQRIAETLPGGWYHPGECGARITYAGTKYESPGFQASEWILKVPLSLQDMVVGSIEVCYRREMPVADEGPFLKEERQLIRTLADRIAQAILHRRLTPVFDRAQGGVAESGGRQNWRSVFEMMRLTDKRLFQKISRRLLNHLCYIGSEDAKALLERLSGMALSLDELDAAQEGNRPTGKRSMEIDRAVLEEILGLAGAVLSDEAIFGHLEKWVEEARVSALLDTLEEQSAPVSDIVDAMTRYNESVSEATPLPASSHKAVSVSLIRRFFSRRLDFISMAKDLVTLDDFYRLTRNLVFPARSLGQLGGKSAGLFLASQIVRHEANQEPELADIRIPRTWYVTADAIMDFIHHNHLEELLEFKYRDIAQIRTEYPNLLMLFKSSSFSPAMVHGLTLALEDFGDSPIIVRSSSLLEDSIGAAFSGKHKSLFIANQGTRKERLEALLDAIAEVYASMFGPDPIQYRAERGLLDFPEAMGLMIQEVVGSRVGKYLFPAYAGVGFTNNEFRWSPRIQRKDGLVRLVTGLGTRAVDRLSNDYPVLLAPGAPNLRVNTSIDEVLRYAPRYMDVINLETNRLETVAIEDVLREAGGGYPLLRQIFSMVRDGLLRTPRGLVDMEKESFVVTCEGLIGDSPFVARIRTLMSALERHYGMPVDIEFAATPTDFYLLQCRPQSSSRDAVSVSIPQGIPEEDLIMTAGRHISDGVVPTVTHVVYVVPEAYAALSDRNRLRDVARFVGRLNSLLPKRQFILVGPGRWGSRGDITLGVPVTYSDISNTAALVEVAFRKGNYLPDLSFGTHFFQDLVEASILYLPVYPDERGMRFKRAFFMDGPNCLLDFVPEARGLEDVLRVVDVRRSTGGRHLRLLMSADEEWAVAHLVDRDATMPQTRRIAQEAKNHKSSDDHWLWRHRMAERIVDAMDTGGLGIVAVYLFGSTKNATAGPGSDIDLLIHVRSTEEQKRTLLTWLGGWSLALAEMNYHKTGIRSDGLLDVHLITDEDIERKTSYAVKIGALSDAARPLFVRKQG